MPQATPYLLGTTVLAPAGQGQASFVSIPATVLLEGPAATRRLLDDPIGFARDVLGLRVGVPIPSPDGVPEVFFASLAGRVTPFDDFSFERWRAQRLQRPDDPRSTFAVEIATSEFVALQQSPVSGRSITSLVARGTSFTVAGWETLAGHPLTGLGVLVVGQFGVVIAQVGRGVADEAHLMARYHARRLRRVFGVPEDWEP